MAALCLMAGVALAHGDLEQQIQRLGQRIQAEPGNAELVLRRADLHRDHGDWRAAAADYDRFQQLVPGDPGVHLGRGKLLLAIERFDAAEVELTAYLQARPQHAEALATRARVRTRLGRLESAVEDFSAAIQASAEPQPEYFVERARAQLALGHHEQALAGLDAGLVRLGPVAGLVLLAVEIEAGLGRHDAALARLSQRAAASARKEAWLERSGDVLVAAGRPGQARQSYEQSKQAIDALPPRLRNTQAMLQLSLRLDAKLGALP